MISWYVSVCACVCVSVSVFKKSMDVLILKPVWSLMHPLDMYGNTTKQTISYWNVFALSVLRTPPSIRGRLEQITPFTAQTHLPCVSFKLFLLLQTTDKMLSPFSSVLTAIPTQLLITSKLRECAKPVKGDWRLHRHVMLWSIHEITVSLTVMLKLQCKPLTVGWCWKIANL